MRMKVGNRLMVAREDRKLNQAEMAELLGMSQSAYSRLERNETTADVEQLTRISQILNVPIQDFLPETLSIQNNSSGQGFVFSSVTNYYNDQAIAQENQHLKEKVGNLEREITDLHQIIDLLKPK